MWLVLCHADDLAALWAFEGLKDRGLYPLELVSAECLAASLRWEHRVDSRGASFRITLADGRCLTSDRVFGALNRLQFVPLPHWQWAPAREREYVQQEMMAFFASWLTAIPGPVLNPASPLGLSGIWRRRAEWIKLAAEAGLVTADYHSGHSLEPASAARRTVIVADGIVPPGVPPANGCRRLAALAQIPLLGIDFEVLDNGIWRFAGATPAPDLRQGAAGLLDALCGCLRGRRT